MTLVAVTQQNSNDDVERNLATVRRNVERAKKRGAELVVLPECFSFLGRDKDYFGIAEPLPENGPDARGGGEIFKVCTSLVREFDVDIIFGGFWEKRPDDKVCNTSLFLKRDGTIGGVYRKIHLFDVELADGTVLKESNTVEPGNELCAVDTEAGRVGMSICYDVRFPELYRGLVDLGAELLTVPAAFTLTTGKDHWEVLLRARAIESQAFVLAAAQVGHHKLKDGSGNRRSWGHAMIIDPWGTVLAQVGDGEGVAVADVDLERLRAIRRELPSLKHRVLKQ